MEPELSRMCPSLDVGEALARASSKTSDLLRAQRARPIFVWIFYWVA
jgi:hypothetical protein